MHDLKPETISRFKELYKNFPELIEYRIKFGNIYEKAQATLIKRAAESVLQMPGAAKQSDNLQNIIDAPQSRSAYERTSRR
jgi:hypothetical protein